MKLINADEAIKKAECYGWDTTAINNAPTVEAEPVRPGKWIDEGYYADYTNVCAWRCSECGWHMISYGHELFRYCPNCGAKMDAERKEE